MSRPSQQQQQQHQQHQQQQQQQQRQQQLQSIIIISIGILFAVLSAMTWGMSGSPGCFCGLLQRESQQSSKFKPNESGPVPSHNIGQRILLRIFKTIKTRQQQQQTNKKKKKKTKKTQKKQKKTNKK